MSTWNPQNPQSGGQQQGGEQKKTSYPSFVMLYKTFYNDRNGNPVPQLQCGVRGRFQKPNGPTPNSSNPELQCYFGKIPITGEKVIAYITKTLGELYGQEPHFRLGDDGTLWADVCAFDREKMRVATNLAKTVEKYGKGCSLFLAGSLSVSDEGEYGLKLKLTVDNFFYIPPYPKNENNGQQQSGYTPAQGGYTAPQGGYAPAPTQQPQAPTPGQQGWPQTPPPAQPPAPTQGQGWPQATAPTQPPAQGQGWPQTTPPAQGQGWPQAAPPAQPPTQQGYTTPPMDNQGFYELSDDDGKLPF